MHACHKLVIKLSIDNSCINFQNSTDTLAVIGNVHSICASSALYLMLEDGFGMYQGPCVEWRK